jgi:hypothetical protein
MRKFKKAGLILATSAMMSMCAVPAFAGATGLGEVQINTQQNVPLAGSSVGGSTGTISSNAGTTVDSTKAAELINGFNAKLNAAQNFGVEEKIHMAMSMTDATKSESMSTDSERYSVVNGDNAYVTVKTTSYDNGVLAETDSSEQYYIKNGAYHNAYEVKNGAVVASEVVQAMNLKENYFPIKVHGNEIVTLENGEYVVRGYMLKEDYANSSTIGGEDVLSSIGLTDDITAEMNAALTNMPYELHFTADGDLTYMQIDMSGLINGVMSIYRAIYGDAIADLGISGQMIYSSQFNINPALTFVVPYYIH